MSAFWEQINKKNQDIVLHGKSWLFGSVFAPKQSLANFISESKQSIFWWILTQILQQKFSVHVITKKIRYQMAYRSPDLTPAVFGLWGYLLKGNARNENAKGANYYLQKKMVHPRKAIKLIKLTLFCWLKWRFRAALVSHPN